MSRSARRSSRSSRAGEHTGEPFFFFPLEALSAGVTCRLFLPSEGVTGEGSSSSSSSEEASTAARAAAARAAAEEEEEEEEEEDAFLR